MTTFTTRELTHDESAQFVRRLHIALGGQALVDGVLRVIAESGLGVFVATKVDE